MRPTVCTFYANPYALRSTIAVAIIKMFSFRPLVAYAIVFLASCTHLPSTSSLGPNDWRTPLENRKLVMKRTVKGHMTFVCSYDGQGFYWKFLRPSGTLLRGANKVGTLNADWSITSNKRHTLKMRIVANGPAESATHLRDVLFKTTLHKTGPFANVHYIERTQARGGMPLTRCSASQQGQTLKRPFEAQYLFWR